MQSFFSSFLRTVWMFFFELNKEPKSRVQFERWEPEPPKICISKTKTEWQEIYAIQNLPKGCIDIVIMTKNRHKNSSHQLKWLHSYILHISHDLESVEPNLQEVAQARGLCCVGGQSGRPGGRHARGAGLYTNRKLMMPAKVKNCVKELV